MASLHQPTTQPPLKKPRINAKPKLTTHQITQPTVIQSALRIGRQARANAPQPGQEHKALDGLLKHMQAWARQLAPQYTPAEFVLAAQAIAGNRELRPMLAEFRLAELRDVNPENHLANASDDRTDTAQPNQSTLNVTEPPNSAVHADVGPVDADVGPVDADVGPVDADVGPDHDDWDELDLVPDEAIEIRPIRKNQTSIAAASTKENDTEHKLSPDIEAKIEQNRRAAVERRKAIIARLHADKEAEEKQSKQHVGRPHEKPTNNPVDAQEQGKRKPELQTDTLSNASPSPSEKGKHLSQKSKPCDDEPSSESVKTVRKDDDDTAKGGQAKNATSKADVCKEALTDVLSKPVLPDHGSQKQGESRKKQEKEDGSSCDLSPTESTKNDSKETNGNQDVQKPDSATSKEANIDQDVNMEILAEFQDGDDA